MESDNCGKTMDAREIERKTGLSEPGELRKECGFIIPAGILIGLGMGILAGYAFTGFLIGLGIGFVGEGLLPLVRKPLTGECMQKGSANVTLLLIGAFLVLVGASIVVAPAAIWPYAFAGLFILAGIWVLFRGFSRSS